MNARRILLWGAVLAGVSAAMTYYGATAQATPDVPPSRPSPARVQELVAVAKPTMRAFTETVPWIGTVEPQARVELTALVAGRIASIEVGDQATIEAGDVIMKLGGAQVESQRRKLEADVALAKSQVALAEQAQTSLTQYAGDERTMKDRLAELQQSREALADKSVARVKQNVDLKLATADTLAAARDAKSALVVQGEQQGQESTRQERSLALQAASAQKALVTARAGLQAAQLALEAFDQQQVIRAPMGGRFTGRRVSVGQAVTVDQAVGEILSPDQVRVVASLFPPRGTTLEGLKATIRLGGEEPVNGTVVQVLPEAGETGATRVWIEGSRLNGALKPGATVDGAIVTQTRQAVAVPTSAVVYDEAGQAYVFVQRDGAYARRAVKPGLTQHGWVEMRAGLGVEETVVTQGAYELFYRDLTHQYTVED